MVTMTDLAPESGPVWLSWSSGKDSVWTLLQLLSRTGVNVTTLLVTLNSRYWRIAMHGVSSPLLARQARSLNLSLYKVYIPDGCSDQTYQAIMRRALQQACRRGITSVVFGDIFLESVRHYREAMLAPLKLKALFPLWGQSTAMLAQAMLTAGIKAVIACVDTRVLPGKWAGQQFDQAFLAALPADVDPCGENGEFHTFVYDGPMFAWPVRLVQRGHYQAGSFCFAALEVAAP